MKKIIDFFLFSIFLASSLVMSYSIFRYLILLICLVFVLYLIILKKYSIKIDKLSAYTFYMFLISFSISAIVNSDSGSFTRMVSLGFIYFGLAIIFNSITQNPLQSISKNILYSHTLIILISILLFNGLSVPFKGLFINPNSMAQLLVTISVPLTAIFHQQIYDYLFLKIKINKSKLFYSTIGLLFIIYLSILTKSRMGTLAIIIIYCLPWIYVFFKSLKKKRTIKKVFQITVLVSIIVGVLVKTTNITYTFNLLIIEKFNAKSGDLTDGRSGVWNQTIIDSTLFGHGRNYFNNLGFGSHNTFIGILGESGWLTLIFFTLFVFISLIKSLNLVLSKDHEHYRFLPFLLITAFLITSMTEGMLFKSLMVALFIISSIKKKPKVSN